MKCLLLLVCLVSAAQEQAPVLAVIEGKVVDGQTGQPIQKAQVALRAVMGSIGMNPGMAAPNATVTDAEGKFALEDVAEGTYMLTVDKSGYLRGNFHPKQPAVVGVPIVVKGGGTMKGYEVKMMPQGVIAGKVVDEDGEPLAGVQVMALRRGAGMPGDAQQLSPRGFAMTNDLGEFRMQALQPGGYYVVAGMRTFGMGFGADTGPAVRVKKPRLGFLPVYYPGVGEVSNARQIEVAAGQKVEAIDLKLRRAPVYQLSGKVAGHERGMRVMLQQREPAIMTSVMMQPNAMVRADGSFDLFDIGPGSYSVILMGANGRAVGRTAVEVSKENVLDLKLTVGGLATLRGKVKIDGDVQQLEQKAGKALSFEAMRVYLRGTEAGPSAYAMGEVTSEGNFTVENVSLGKHRVMVSGAPPGTWLKALNQDGKNLLETGFEAQMAGSMTVDLVLGTGVGTVKGVAVDEKKQPAPGVLVLAVPEPFAKWQMERFRRQVSNQEGGFTMPTLPVGEYLLVAVDAAAQIDMYDAEQMKPLLGKAQRVKVDADGQVDVSVAMQVVKEGKQ